MNASATIVVSLLAASAASIGLRVALPPQPDPEQRLLVDQLRSGLRTLQDDNNRLRQRLDELQQATPAPATAAMPVERREAPTISPEQVAAAVEAYLRRRADAEGDPAATAVTGFDMERDFGDLVGTNYWEDSALWKRAFAAGKMDEVLAAFEQRVADRPNDVNAKMDLANAYLAFLQLDPSKWQLSMQADRQFDKVLEIDDKHWGARFTKAVSYTFWPEFTGKRGEAIKHFETLVAQQEAMPVEEHQAQTYLYLGNMLVDRDPERAREVWRRGLARHPHNAELRKLLQR